MKPVYIRKGNRPVILAMPHTGTYIPGRIFAGLNANGRKLADTDWHVDRLYRGLLPGVTIIKANFHRYVVDANRDPLGASLYPGQNTTGLCPVTDFDGHDIYKANSAPNESEIEQRRRSFHAPYHSAVEGEIARLRQIYKDVVLYDCHSIRSRAPFLFEGALPDFNIGTNSGVTCGSQLEQQVAKICKTADGFIHVVNGRFKGGWTTRHYGKPEGGVHAIQMELAQNIYMDEQSPWHYQPKQAKQTRRVLREILQAIEKFAG